LHCSEQKGNSPGDYGLPLPYLIGILSVVLRCNMWTVDEAFS